MHFCCKCFSYIEPEDVLNQVQHLQLMEVLHMSRYGFSYQSSYSGELFKVLILVTFAVFSFRSAFAVQILARPFRLRFVLITAVCLLWLLAEFFDRFIIIAQPRIVIPSTPREEIDFKPLCEQLLHGVRSNEVFAGADLGATVQFGTTRIFLKADAIRGLEVRFSNHCVADVFKKTLSLDPSRLDGCTFEFVLCLRGCISVTSVPPCSRPFIAGHTRAPFGHDGQCSCSRSSSCARPLDQEAHESYA